MADGKGRAQRSHAVPGVYWMPVFEVLEQHGPVMYLVNAQHAKNVPGRKSDIHECQVAAEVAHFCPAE